MSNFSVGPKLQEINSPYDLRTKYNEDLPDISKELREYIIDVISEIGNSHLELV